MFLASSAMMFIYIVKHNVHKKLSHSLAMIFYHAI